MKNKFSIALSLAVIMSMLLTSIGLADDLYNLLDNDIPDNQKESVTITAGGSVSVGFKIRSTTGAGDVAGCNVDDGSRATLTINPPVGVTVSGPVEFSACDVEKEITFYSNTPNALGYDINTSDFVLSGGKTGSKWATNTATFKLFVNAAPPSDTTAPIANPSIAGTTGTNGWYTSDVTVTWNWADNAGGSGIDPNNCTMSSTSSGEGTIPMSATCTDLAGNTGSASVTVKVDKTAPTAILAVTAGTLGLNDWYTSDVTVTTSGVDAVSGATCTADQYLTAESIGTEFNGSCTNGAGLSTNAEPLTIKLDKTAPTATLAVTAGTTGANGWYTSDVTVSTSGVDAVSGVNCTAVQYQTDETSGKVFNGSCTNGAGLSTNAAPLTIKLDKTGPSANLAVTTGTLGLNGWYTSDVTVSTSGADLISSPVSCTGDQYLTVDSAGTGFNGSCTNDAGLTTNAALLTVKRDATVPTAITFEGGPAAGGSYYFGNVPAAPTCTADGAISGLASCAVTGYGTTVGSQTMTATATDNAGNIGTAQQLYTVLAWTLKGFYQPVDMSTPTTTVWNTVKGGSTVPLKFEVFADTELTSISVVKSFTVVGVACNGSTADDIELTTTGGTSLRYDATAGQFIQNWQTPRTVGSCYKVTMTTQDGSFLSAFFKIK